MWFFQNKVLKIITKFLKKKKIFKNFQLFLVPRNLRNEPEFKKRKVVWCYSWEDLKDQIKGSDIVNCWFE